MSSPTPIPPFYQPISFVSPISDNTRPHNHHDSEHPSHLRRLSTYLKNAVTLEDNSSASRRESVISDRGSAQAEHGRHVSIASTQDEQEDRALLAWRRPSEEGFWKKHGSVSGDAGGERRKSSVANEKGEVSRRSSVVQMKLGMS